MNHFSFIMPMVLFLAVFVLGQHSVQAQKLSKQDEDKYKTLAKQYKKNPAMLASLMEKYNEYKDENTELKEKLNLLEASGNRKSERIGELESQVNAVQAQLAQCRAKQQEVEAAMQQMAPAVNTDAQWSQGVVYRVQMGAFKDKKMPADWETSDGLSLEEDGSMQKIVVGHFRDYNAAAEMKNKLKAMGIKGAWVVSYKDGQRVPITQI